MKMHRRFIAVGMLLLGVVVMPDSALCQMDRHLGTHNRMKRGPKMNIAAASFFGGGGTEEFIGVMQAANGDIVAIGNSWGPPFPQQYPVSVIGPGQLWDIPLLPPGHGSIKDGPAANHPNRTGFMVFFSENLRSIRRVTRFGWGLASITGSVVTRDGGLVIGGMATRNFRAVAREAAMMNTYALSGDEEASGAYRFASTLQPGDVYVGRLNRTLDGFEWVWILEGNRHPPQKLFEGRDGDIFFDSRGVMGIMQNGRKFIDYREQTGSALVKGRMKQLHGVHPQNGNLLLGGDRHWGTGREPWRMPVLQIFTPDGRMASSFYEWPGPLVGVSFLRLVSDSAVRAAAFAPNGDVYIAGWSDGGNSVFTRSPIDLEKRARGIGFDFPSWGVEGAMSFVHIMRFNLDDPHESDHMVYCSQLQTYPNSMSAQKMIVTGTGRVAIMASSASFLVQTTTEWFRAPDQYQRETMGQERLDVRILENGWPAFQGIGGRGSHIIVFDGMMTNVYWSSAIANMRHQDMIGTRDGGIVAVGSVNGDGIEGRDASLWEYDIAYPNEFARKLVAQARASRPSAGRQVWKYLRDDTRKNLFAVVDGNDLTTDMVAELRDDINDFLFDARDFYDPQIWSNEDFTRYERIYISQLHDPYMPEDSLGILNRCLLERSFPEHIFPHPKENRPPIVNAAQETFGGGFSDGHIYLLRDVASGGAK